MGDKSRASDNTQWLPEITHHSSGTPIILVGTKIDLRDDPATRAALTKQHMEPVKYENVLNYVKEVNKTNKIIYKYIECSALTQRNLKSVFDEAIR